MIGEVPQSVLVEACHLSPHERDACDLDRVVIVAAMPPPPMASLVLWSTISRRQPLDLDLHLLDGRDRLILVHTQRLDDLRERRAQVLSVRHSAQAGERFNAADAGGDAAFGRITKQPMSPVAPTCVPPQSSMLKPGYADDAHLVAVFLAEQRHGARRDGFLGWAHLGLHGRVLEDLLVDDPLDAIELLAVTPAGNARSRSAADRARRAIPPVSRARRAPGAAPRAAGAWRCGCGAWRCARVASTSAVTMSRTLSAPLVTRTRCARGKPGRIRTSPSTSADRAGGFVRNRARVGHLAAGLEVERRSRQRDIAVGVGGSVVHRLPSLRRTAPRPAHRSLACRRSPRTDRPRLSSSVFVSESELLRPSPPPKALCARPCSRCAFIARSYPALIDADVVRGRRVLDEIVGNAERVVEPERRVAREQTVRRFEGAFAISASRRGRPSVRTASKRFSSARIVFSIVSRLVRSSG